MKLFKKDKCSCSGGIFFFIGLLLFLSIIGHAKADTVVASTSLTGAIALAAGATDVRILTPQGIKHPPEYELIPSDLLKLEGAKIVIYAGYERMVSRLLDTTRNKKIIPVQINTAMSPENIIEQTRKIAKALNTEDRQKAWESLFTEKLKNLRKKLEPYSEKKAVVHFHAQPFTRWAGLSVVQVINPGEISPKALTEALAKKPDIVVDILHFPVAKEIANNSKAGYALLINFPGISNTVTIEDIFYYNTEQILKAFNEKL